MEAFIWDACSLIGTFEKEVKCVEVNFSFCPMPLRVMIFVALCGSICGSRITDTVAVDTTRPQLFLQPSSSHTLLIN